MKFILRLFRNSIKGAILNGITIANDRLRLNLTNYQIEQITKLIDSILFGTPQNIYAETKKLDATNYGREKDNV